MFATVGQFLAMIRFSHTLFALPFAMVAAAMAWYAGSVGEPRLPFRWQDLLGILLCMVLARTAAMGFNRLADRHLDAANPRTANRHLPTGTLSVAAVAGLTLVSGVLFVLATLLFLPNVLPLALSLPVLGFVLGYSYAKRFTSWVHVWLGAALALAPLAAWIAIRGQLVWADPADLLAPLVLGLAVLAWVSGFDMLYAAQDAEFDRATGLYSVPATWGVPAALRLAAACHAAMVVLLAILPWAYPWLGWLYWAGLAAIAALLVYEHRLVRPDDLSRVNTAFFHVNAVISLGLLAVVLADLYLLGGGGQVE